MFHHLEFETCGGRIDNGILLGALNSPNLRTIYDIFIGHIIVLAYFVVFRWKPKSVREFKWFIPRIRRHLASAMGMSSIISGISGLEVAERDCILGRTSVALSCVLSFLAVLCAYGCTKRPGELIGLFISIASLALCIPSLRTFNQQADLDHVYLRFTFGLYHVLLGLVLFLRRERSRSDEIAWHLRNGDPPRFIRNF